MNSEILVKFKGDTKEQREILVKLKELGYNTIRKHIKVEPERFYYHCDKLGMMVWQDMPKWPV